MFERVIMQKKAIGTLLGGLFNHLVNDLTYQKDTVWEKNQFGGAISPYRPCPYVIFGKQESRAWRSVTFDGEHHRIELELYCGAVTLNKAKSFTKDIVTSLHDADFPLKGHALIEIQYNQAEYIKIADNTEYMVRLLFTVLTVSD